VNVVLVVVDSLRARSLGRADAGGPRTPFLDRLARETITFRQARATECWTLPTHLSMFTGLLPSEHDAHFQTMAYAGAAPTVAEILRVQGRETEVVTRNSIFDGTMPGVTRGFAANTTLLAELRRVDPIMLLVTLAKPRVRRMIRTSGFIDGLQRQNRHFVLTLARMTIPADERVLVHALERMSDWRARGRPYFLFLNLYDVHAPYAPRLDSPLRSFRNPRGALENLALPFVVPKIATHGYLRPGFKLSARSRRMLFARYQQAIELMDGKLAAFYDAARAAGLLDDTLLVVTSDHGEAFGEHGLFFHDASVYDTHLHVPLWIHHPGLAPATVDDVVSTRGLFDLLARVAANGGIRGTILDPGIRKAMPVALAEHFHYSRTGGLLDRYAQNIAAAVVGRRKLILRREGPHVYDLERDPDETAPEPTTVATFEGVCRRDGVPAGAVAAAAAHLRRWEASLSAAGGGRPASVVGLRDPLARVSGHDAPALEGVGLGLVD
jgi:arylsulfatase A-like enzyme